MHAGLGWWSRSIGEGRKDFNNKNYKVDFACIQAYIHGGSKIVFQTTLLHLADMTCDCSIRVIYYSITHYCYKHTNKSGRRVSLISTAYPWGSTTMPFQHTNKARLNFQKDYLQHTCQLGLDLARVFFITEQYNGQNIVSDITN